MSAVTEKTSGKSTPKVVDKQIFATPGFPLLSPEEKLERFQTLVDLLLDSSRPRYRRLALDSLKIISVAFKPEGDNLEIFKHQCETSFKIELERMVNEQDYIWSEIWQFLVSILGAEMHNAKVLLNTLLGVLEKALKKKDTKTLVLAFKCWSSLIDNFAINPEVIAGSRRIELLMIPLGSKLAKEPHSWTQKCYTWWHLIITLGPNIVKYPNVFKQFFTFCFGPTGKDVAVRKLKLRYKVPALSSFLLNILQAVLGMGVPKLHEKTIIAGPSFSVPSVALLNSPKDFAAIHREAIQAVVDYVREQFDDEQYELVLQAVAFRIQELQKDPETSWPAAATELLDSLKGVATVKATAENPEKKVVELLNTVGDSLLAVWDPSFLAAKRGTSTPQEFLLEMCLEHLPLLIHNSKPNLEKREERFIKLIGRLMEHQHTLVAGPEYVSDLTKLIQALESILKTSKTKVDQGVLTKMLHLWDHFARIVSKILPAESANEECNTLFKEKLLQLMLLPLRWLLENDSQTYTIPVEKALSCWKQMLHKYVDMSAVSLSLNKKHPFNEICEGIQSILTAKTYPVSTIISMIHISSQIVALRHSPYCAALKDLMDEHQEVQLLAKAATMLREQMSIPNEVSRIGSTRAAKVLTKTLKYQMITQTNLQHLISTFKIFFILLMIPNLHMKDEDLSEIWSVFTHHFTTIMHKLSPGANKMDMKNLLKSLIPDLVTLKRHSNIKVQRGAEELEDALNKTVYCQSPLNDNAATARSEEAGASSPRTFNPPSQSMLSFKRGRKSVQNLSFSSPAAFATASQSKPTLEDQDSQDFVKIPPKTKAKRVLTQHQKESKRRRRDDIPALYQGLSQDTFNSDTQDTQDSPMDCVTPMPASTTTSLDLFNEDAIDIDMPAVLKPTSEGENTIVISEVVRPILEPIPVESEANKTSQDDFIFIESALMPQPASQKKDDSSMESTTSKENMLAVDPPSNEVRKLHEVVEAQLKPLVIDDDEIMFIKETPSPSKNKEIQKQEIEKVKEDSQKSTDSQDVEIVEDSQNTEATPADTPAVPVQPQIQLPNGIRPPDSNERSGAKLRNRQGVLLPSRLTRYSDGSSRDRNFPTRMKGRGAHLLEMVNASKSHEPRATTSETKEAPCDVQQVQPTEVKSIPDTQGDSAPTTSYEPLITTPRKEPGPSTSSSNDVNVTPTTGDQFYEDISPDKMSLVYQTTPQSSRLRSNLKRPRENVNKTPSPKTSKRVSFTEPLVTSEQESPTILQEKATFDSVYKCFGGKSAAKRKARVSRQLPMMGALRASRSMARAQMIIAPVVPSQGSLPTEPVENLDSPIFPPLVNCLDSVDSLVSQLTSPMLAEALIENLRNFNITTVGDLSTLQAIHVRVLEIREPKIETLRTALSEYASRLQADDQADDQVNDQADDQVNDQKDDQQEDLIPEVPSSPELTPMPMEPEPEEEENKPIIQEPDDDTSELAEQLKCLVQEHSLEKVLQALGQAGIVTRPENTDAASQSVSIVPPPEEEVLDQVFASKDRPKVLAKMASNLTSTELISVCSMHQDEIQASESTDIDEVAVVKALKTLGHSQKVLDHLIQDSEPITLLQSLEKAGKVTPILSHIQPSRTLKAIATRVTVPELLLTVGKAKAVVDYIIQHCNTQELTEEIVKKCGIDQLMRQVGRPDEILKYVMSNTRLIDILKLAVTEYSTELLLKELENQQQIADYTIKQFDVIELLKKIPMSDIIHGMLRHKEDFPGASQAMLTEAAKLTPTVDIVQLIDREDELVDALILAADPVLMVKKAAEVLRDGDLTKIVITLEPSQQEEVCCALPSQVLLKQVETFVNGGQLEDPVLQILMPAVSNEHLLDEFIQRCINVNSESLKSSLSDSVISRVKDPNTLEVLISALKSNADLKDAFLKSVENIELTSVLIEKLQIDPDCVNEKQMMQLSNLLPQQAIIDRLKSDLSDQLVATTFAPQILPLFTSSDLINYLTSVCQLNSERNAQTMNPLLDLLPTTSLLEKVLEKFTEKAPTKKAQRVLGNLAKDFLTLECLTMIIKSRPEEEKSEVLESLVLDTPFDQVVRMCNINKVIEYYKIMIEIPEYKGDLLKSSLEQVMSAGSDFFKYLGVDNFLKLMRKELVKSDSAIMPQQIVTLLPQGFVSNWLWEQIAGLKTTESTVKVLKEKFPRSLLARLASDFILNKQIPHSQ